MTSRTYYILTMLCVIGLFSVSQSGISQNNARSHSDLIYHPKTKWNLIKDAEQIYSQLINYYQAVEEADIDLLNSVFNENWHMRDDDVSVDLGINVEDKSEFITRVKQHGPYQDYAKDRSFVNISMAHDQLALVQVNKGSATYFFLEKDEDTWMISDKIWVTRQRVTKALSTSCIDSIVQSYYRAINSEDREQLNELLHEDWEIRYLSNQGSWHQMDRATFIEHPMHWSVHFL